MSDAPQPVDDLSPEEKRALLRKLLRKKARKSKSAPLSFAQQRLWFLDQLMPGDPVYNETGAARFQGPLHVAALEQTLSEIVRRHEILRTTFAPVDGQPVQVIAPALTLTLPVVDLCGLPETEREAQVLRLATEEGRWPFDLAQGPLLRAKLLHLADQEHVFLLTIHHIVCDGWSVAVLIREIAALYKAFCTGSPSPLPELPIQYADFAHWQRQWLQGEVLEAQLSYWKQQLGGTLPVLDLPTDRPRPVVQTFRGATQRFALPPALTEALKALSHGEGVTLFMTLLAAFKTLLHRYTGQKDIVVGSPIANRSRVEVQGLIGFFVNTLALRTDLSGDPSFRELLGRVRAVALGAYAHQDLPFEKLVESLQLERNRNYTPLFQVGFVLQPPIPVLELPGLTMSPLDVDTGTAKNDLILGMWESESPQGLAGFLVYNTDLFDGATIARMWRHFQTLLEGVVADPEQRLSTLPLLTAAERQQLLAAWNNTQTEYVPDQCIHQLFEAQVARTPTATAVVFEDELLTYQALNRRANQLACYLQKLGVGPEVLVGICVERSLEMVVGLLGILKAGGAYVPLDPAYPEERLAFMLEDAQVPVLLTQQRLVGRLPAGRAQVVCLDSDWEVIARECEKNPVSGATAENLAYVIYTSGSTGKPRGVLINHGNIVRLFSATHAWFHFDHHDVWTLFHSYAFDFSVWEMWGALIYGGRLVIVPHWMTRSPEAFYELLAGERVTVLNQTPSAFYQFMRAEEEIDSVGKLALRLVIFGGEALELKRLQPWFERHGDQRPQLVNMYGVTETTVHVTYCPLNAADVAEFQGSPIGSPIPDLQLYLLDQHLQPVPSGVSGEMYIGGAGLARGYLNHPELTAEKFIPHPFSKKPGARLYRTGDLARCRPHGNIEFLGRSDDQVKIRGFRIEVGEIEAVLAQHPAVQEAVVTAREDVPGDRRLVAYIVFNRGQTTTIGELRGFLREKLPEYMVPSAFVFLDTLPLTPSGKVDRRALPAPERARPELEQAFIAPRTPAEALLAKIWAQVLGVEQMGVHDNFFELGGHSLLATQLIFQVREAFQVELPLRCLFETPTVAGLAESIETARWAEQGWQVLAPRTPLVKIQLRGSKRPLFFLHPAGGTVLCYADLARHLGPDQPFYGLQSQGLDGEDPHTQIEAMAAHYIEALRAVQREGPYLLGGWSMGGILAFEMAQQLQAQGQEVALLALLDAWAMAPGEEPAEEDGAALLASFAQEIGLSSERITLLLHRFRQLGPDEQLTYVLEQAKIADLLPSHVGLPEVPRHLHVFKTNIRAMRSYIPRAYPSRVTLFRASEQFAAASQDPTMGWSELAAGGVEIQVVPGNHYTMLRAPHVQILAERLRAYLQAAQ